MLAGAKWFFALDLKSGGWQVNLHPDNEKTAFSTGLGVWQFTVIPFGLCNAPAMSYLDDVIVIDHTFQEHLFKLQKVSQQFREACLKLSPETCQPFQRK
jgi:hypothetical protein